MRAVDGTTFRLPPAKALASAFGEQDNGPTLARGSILYDIGHDLVLDAQVAAPCVGEHEMAIEHLAAAAPGDLLLYDRGYPAFWFFALHLKAGIDFCMRLSRRSFAPANAFWEGHETSQVVTLTPSREQRRACGDQDVAPEPIAVRLVRVRLKGGETEILVTSVLDEQRPHTLVRGISRVGGTDYRFRIHHYDGRAYQEIDQTAVDRRLPVLFKPMGSPHPDATYIASDADYVDYITELMGGFAIPDFLKSHRKGRQYCLIGLRLLRDTERMVLSEIIHAAGAPTGWALIPEPTDKERRFCQVRGFEIIQQDITQLIAAAGLQADSADATRHAIAQLIPAHHESGC